MVLEQILLEVADIINYGKRRIIVAIDGVDASGKTYFAQKLKRKFDFSGIKSEVITIDNFHNKKEERYKKGKDSPVGFYEDSYNYKIFLTETIRDFKEFKSKIKSKHFDLDRDEESEKFIQVDEVQVLIIEGIFLHRKELYENWDYSIFLEVSLEQSLCRNVFRTMVVSENCDENKLKKRFSQRYIEGQKIYLQEEFPRDKANLIIDNTDFNTPKIIRRT